jgi:predicted nucleic acid-binding Zn ribbon protein
MMRETGRRTSCENLNHRRAQPPVRHCPMCGALVNEHLAAPKCSEAHHAAERRQRATYCVACGTQLIFEH